MVRKGPTRRKRGDIWAQLGVSACVLLLPPFVMAAGVMYLGSSPSQDTSQSAAQQAVAPDASVTKPVSMADRSDMRPDAGTSFALASAGQQAAVTEQRPVAAQSPVAVAKPPAATAPPAPGAQRQVAAQAPAAQAPAAQARRCSGRGREGSGAIFRAGPRDLGQCRQGQHAIDGGRDRGPPFSRRGPGHGCRGPGTNAGRHAPSRVSAVGTA